MKSLILLLALFCTVSAADKPKRLFLLIGQSNMAGRAPIDKGDEKPIKNTFLLDSQGKWQPAANPLNQFSTIRKGLGMQKMSIGYGFAKRSVKTQKNQSASSSMLREVQKSMNGLKTADSSTMR